MKKETKTLLWLIRAIYFAQGLTAGLVGTFLYWTLLDMEIGLTEDIWADIKFFALLPWGFKFLLGPIADRFGKYRFWVIVTSLIAAVMILPLMMVPTFTWITIVLCIHSLMRAYSDVITDGWALSLVSKGERGSVQAATRIGSSTGMFLGGSMLMLLSVVISWEWCLAIVALVMTAPAMIAFFGKPKEPSKEETTTFKETWQIFKKLFTGPSLAAVGIALLAYTHALMMNLFTPWLQKVIWIGKVEGLTIIGIGVLATVFGAIQGNRIVRSYQYDRRRALLLATGLLAVTYAWAGNFMSDLHSLNPGRAQDLMLISALVGFVDGIYAVALGTLFMDITKGITKSKAQTTIYAIFMALISLSLLTIFPWLGSYLWSEADLPTAVMIGGGLQLLTLPLLLGVKLDRK
jgi:MFS family permease